MQERTESARGMRARWRDGRIPPREARDGPDTTEMEVGDALANGGEVDGSCFRPGAQSAMAMVA